MPGFNGGVSVGHIEMAPSSSCIQWSDDFNRSELGSGWVEGPRFADGFYVTDIQNDISGGSFISGENDPPFTDSIYGSIRSTLAQPGDMFIEATVGNFFQGHWPALDEGYQYVEADMWLFTQVVGGGSQACLGVRIIIQTNQGPSFTGGCYMQLISVNSAGVISDHNDGAFFPLTGWQDNPNYTIRLETTADGHCVAMFEGAVVAEDDLTPTGGSYVGMALQWNRTNYDDGPNSGVSPEFMYATGGCLPSHIPCSPPWREEFDAPLAGWALFEHPDESEVNPYRGFLDPVISGGSMSHPVQGPDGGSDPLTEKFASVYSLVPANCRYQSATAEFTRAFQTGAGTFRSHIDVMVMCDPITGSHIRALFRGQSDPSGVAHIFMEARLYEGGGGFVYEYGGGIAYTGISPNPGSGASYSFGVKYDREYDFFSVYLNGSFVFGNPCYGLVPFSPYQGVSVRWSNGSVGGSYVTPLITAFEGGGTV